MEIALAVLGFIVFCGLGIAWDFYKPTRFRRGYHNISANRSSPSGGGVGLSGSDGSSSGDCRGGD